MLQKRICVSSEVAAISAPIARDFFRVAPTTRSVADVRLFPCRLLLVLAEIFFVRGCSFFCRKGPPLIFGHPEWIPVTVTNTPMDIVGSTAFGSFFLPAFAQVFLYQVGSESRRICLSHAIAIRRTSEIP